MQRGSERGTKRIFPGSSQLRPLLLPILISTARRRRRPSSPGYGLSLAKHWSSSGSSWRPNPTAAQIRYKLSSETILKESSRALDNATEAEDLRTMAKGTDRVPSIWTTTIHRIHSHIHTVRSTSDGMYELMRITRLYMIIVSLLVYKGTGSATAPYSRFHTVSLSIDSGMPVLLLGLLIVHRGSRSGQEKHVHPVSRERFGVLARRLDINATKLVPCSRKYSQSVARVRTLLDTTAHTLAGHARNAFAESPAAISRCLRSSLLQMLQHAYPDVVIPSIAVYLPVRWRPIKLFSGLQALNKDFITLKRRAGRLFLYGRGGGNRQLRNTSPTCWDQSDHSGIRTHAKTENTATYKLIALFYNLGLAVRLISVKKYALSRSTICVAPKATSNSRRGGNASYWERKRTWDNKRQGHLFWQSVLRTMKVPWKAAKRCIDRCKKGVCRYKRTK